MEPIEKQLLKEIYEKRMIDPAGNDLYSAVLCRKLEKAGWIKVTWSEENKPIMIAQSRDFMNKYKRVFG